MLVIAPQFAGQLRRGLPLGDAAQQQEDLGRAEVGLLQRRASEGIEDAPAAGAAVVEHRVAVAAMDTGIASAAAGAGQAIGVEPGDELVVAGAVIEVVGQREIHGGSLQVGSDSPRSEQAQGLPSNEDSTFFAS